MTATVLGAAARAGGNVTETVSAAREGAAARQPNMIEAASRRRLSAGLRDEMAVILITKKLPNLLECRPKGCVKPSRGAGWGRSRETAAGP